MHVVAHRAVLEGAPEASSFLTGSSPHPFVPRIHVVTKSKSRVSFTVAGLVLAAALAHSASAQSADPAAAMHWREIGPTRAGRARALTGVPSQPNVFYIGFDNGGVWRSTDYGSNWESLFDTSRRDRSARSACAPSNPNVDLRRHRRGHHPARPRRGRRRCTSRPMPGRRGRTSACSTRR